MTPRSKMCASELQPLFAQYRLVADIQSAQDAKRAFEDTDALEGAVESLPETDLEYMLEAVGQIVPDRDTPEEVERIKQRALRRIAMVTIERAWDCKTWR